MNSYLLVLIPPLAFVVAQGLKILINLKRQPFGWKAITAYGGMPSSHMAFVTSAATLAGLLEGFDSAVFILAVTMVIVILRDALGMRMVISRQGEVIKDLAHKHQSDWLKIFPRLGERIGHRPTEAFVGLFLGVALAFLFYQVFAR